MGPAQYQDITAQITTDPPLCFTGGTRHSGFQTSLGTLQTQTQRDVRNNVKESSSDRISNHQTSRLYDDHTIFSPIIIVFSNHRFSNCSSTVDVGLVKLALGHFCGNRVLKMNIEFCCHLCCSSSTIFIHSPLQFMGAPFTEFWYSATIPIS